MSASAYISLGSNICNPFQQIKAALQALALMPHTQLVTASSLKVTKPVGYLDQPDFINAAAKLETQLAPHQLLRELQKIEQLHNRIRDIRWGPRTLDLDLIAYDNIELDTPQLTLPHPRMHEREFVLAPLMEIDPVACQNIRRASIRKTLKSRYSV